MVTITQEKITQQPTRTIWDGNLENSVHSLSDWGQDTTWAEPPKEFQVSGVSLEYEGHKVQCTSQKPGVTAPTSLYEVEEGKVDMELLVDALRDHVRL